jgi:uncharacterized membrane protein YdjX (TVP38/TMEM64 family)
VKELLKIMLILALFFASTFLLLKLTGVLSLDEVHNLLVSAHQNTPLYLALLVVLLLYADLFIAVPTMTVAMLAGYFLGWPLGAAATLTGFFLAGITGYLISRRYGSALLQRIYNDSEKLVQIEHAFNHSGPWVLISCRALPILPEVSCCMAGATRMAFSKFLPLFALGSVPYALIVTYAGSVSSLERPQPAILTAIILTLLLWVGWYLIAKRTPPPMH